MTDYQKSAVIETLRLYQNKADNETDKKHFEMGIQDIEGQYVPDDSKEKEIKKNPVYKPMEHDSLYSDYLCPHCYTRLPRFKNKRCKCGQMINWI